VEAGVRQAFAEIETQLADHKAALQGERLWKRLARRRDLHERKAQPQPPDEQDRKAFLKLIRPHLERLNDFVRHELEYVVANGDLAPGELTPDDVVDATL